MSIHRSAGASETPLPVFDLGVASYSPVQCLQERLRNGVASGTIGGVLLLLEHTPVITLGRRGTSTDVSDWRGVTSRGVHVTRSERGGQATLHCPGQLVTYPILPIPHRDVRTYVRNLEQVLLTIMRSKGLSPRRRPGHPGLYLEERKIASLGLRCQQGIASHGSSLNVDLDLSLFELLTCCGEPSLRQTSMSRATGTSYSMQDLKEQYVAAFSKVFALSLDPVRTLPYDQVETLLGMVPMTAATS